MSLNTLTDAGARSIQPSYHSNCSCLGLSHAADPVGPVLLSTPRQREPRQSHKCYVESDPEFKPMLATKLVTSEDPNAQETSEWLEALDGVVEEGGADRAAYLLDRLIERAALYGVQTPTA